MGRTQPAQRIVMPTLPEILTFTYKGASKTGKMQMFAAATQFEWQRDLMLMLDSKDCTPDHVAAFPGWAITAPLGWAKVEA